MELDVLEVHLRHLKHITAVGKEHIPSLTVFRHILVLTLLERFLTLSLRHPNHNSNQS